MTPEQFLDHVAADSAHFASAAAGSLDQNIDFLEGWSVHDMVAHLGNVYSYVISNTENPGTERGTMQDAPAAPEGEAINEWFAGRRTALLTTLSGGDDDAVAWTHAGIKTVGWWKRRMACETSIHRWDCEAATEGLTNAPPIDDDLATEIVEEYLEVSLRPLPDRAFPAESLHLHRSDGPGEWMIVAGGDGVIVTHEHGKGDAAVRGPASDLALWLWGRPTAGVEIFGSEDVAAAWQTA